MTSFNNQLVTSELITCNRLVVKLSQAIRTHRDIGLMIKLLQDVNRLVAASACLVVQGETDL